MGVILFPQWRIFGFVSADGQSFVRVWLDRNSSQSTRGSLLTFLQCIQSGGPRVLPGCIKNEGDGLGTIEVKRSGHPPIRVFFCYGPFHPYDALVGDESTGEITLLGASMINRDALKDAKKIAKENLKTLLEDPSRRQHERFGERSRGAVPR